jgi:hypothetical protein
MAQRRMFSLKIVGSDSFLDMPASTRELYFQLGMYGDDDGFVNPHKILRLTGASLDDLKILISKRFIIPFENGVIVIKHWHINNLIRKDFYQSTLYEDQKNTLNIKNNGVYTENNIECLQNVNNLSTQVSIVKYRIGKVNKGKHRYLEFVYLTTIEFFKLRELFGKKETRDKLERLNLYKGSTGKKYASDYLTILNWERKNNKSNPIQQQPDDRKRQIEYQRRQLEEQGIKL